MTTATTITVTDARIAEIVSIATAAKTAMAVTAATVAVTVMAVTVATLAEIAPDSRIAITLTAIDRECARPRPLKAKAFWRPYYELASPRPPRRQRAKAQCRTMNRTSTATDAPTAQVVSSAVIVRTAPPASAATLAPVAMVELAFQMKSVVDTSLLQPQHELIQL